jgi:hypothetical protein
MPAMETLTRAEKLQMMEALWDDLTRADQPYPSPAWHGEALQATEQAYQAGETGFIDWDTAKQLLRGGQG